jgi:hypothetical protein
LTLFDCAKKVSRHADQDLLGVCSDGGWECMLDLYWKAGSLRYVCAGVMDALIEGIFISSIVSASPPYQQRISYISRQRGEISSAPEYGTTAVISAPQFVRTKPLRLDFVLTTIPTGCSVRWDSFVASEEPFLCRRHERATGEAEYLDCLR